MHILDKLHWCVMETSFLVQLDYGHANLGWTSSAHTYGEYAENVIVSGVCFYFSFRPDDMVNKMRHYIAGGTALHTLHEHYRARDGVVHILDHSNFCVSFLCIMNEFGHSSIT